MRERICYLGDDHLGGAAAYLAGIMTHFGLPFDHVASSESPPADMLTETYRLYVLSDYPAGRFQLGRMDDLAGRVRDGSGLLMIGGWESFHGRAGEYHGTRLADVLPVEMLDADDRRNCAQPCLVRKIADHPILDELPWDVPPGIGGFNAFSARPGSQTLLTAVQCSVQNRQGSFELTPRAESPLLVVGEYGRGRTAALATDVAPHWVGGLVDWGDQRLFQEVGAGFIEVGNWYAEFFRNLLQWTMGAKT
ncbi:MAG: glutamine amidotransferase [Thermoguttaceae bacterium]